MWQTQHCQLRPTLYYTYKNTDQEPTASKKHIAHPTCCTTCLRTLQVQSQTCAAYLPRPCLSCEVHYRCYTGPQLQMISLPTTETEQIFYHLSSHASHTNSYQIMLWRRLMSYLPRWRCTQVHMTIQPLELKTDRKSTRLNSSH